MLKDMWIVTFELLKSIVTLLVPKIGQVILLSKSNSRKYLCDWIDTLRSKDTEILRTDLV
jgi:hypothetical protein